MDVQEWMERAASLQDKGDFIAAEECYREILRQEPGLEQAHYLLAWACHRNGKNDAAIAGANLAIGLFPVNGHLYNLLGACYLARNETVAAEFCFRRAILLLPAHPNAYKNLGLMLLNMGRKADAQSILIQFLSLDPTDFDVIFSVARVSQELGQFDQALALYERARQLRPENPAILLAEAGCLQSLNRYPEALEIVDRMLILDGINRSEVLRLKGILLNLTGRDDEACETFDSALRENPESIELACSRASIRKVSADEPFFRHMQAFEPKLDAIGGAARTKLRFSLGKIYQDVGNIAAAAKYFAAGGADVLASEPYDEAGELAQLTAIARNVTRNYLDTFAGQGSESHRPIFIVGMERSGTTLTEQILISHPDVFPGGELRFFAHVLGGFRLPDGTQFGMSEQDKFGPDTTIRQRAERYLQKIDALPGAMGKPRVTDKMPENFAHIGMILALFPHARIIHCRRDPIDNCISSYTTHFGGGMGWSYDLGTMGRRYRSYWDLMAHWRKELPGRFLEMRYEQMVENTEQAARTLLDWCGLAWDERVLRFFDTQRAVHTASVNQVRQPIYKSSVGRWKKWEPYIQPLLAEIGDLERQYWAELE